MIQILTVCAVGVGSSLMLKMNADKVVKNHGFKAKIENTNMTGAMGYKPDILITTADIYGQIKGIKAKEVVILTNMVSKKELEEKLVPALEAVNE